MVENDFQEFVELSARNVIYSLEPRFDYLPPEFKDALARKLISWLEPHLTSHALDEKPSSVISK
jgi:hypothetical protein